MEQKIDHKNLSDEELVGLLNNGDGAAFVEIFSRFRVLLFSFAYKRLGDKELTKDLIHDAFADIWEKRSSLNIPGGLPSFLVTVIKNRILNHYKHQKVSQKYIDSFQKYLSNQQDTTDYLVRNNDLSALIEKEIAALPEKMRRVFELSRKNHLSRQEIAEHLDVPEGNVKINMQRALKILKGRLGDTSIIALIYFTFLS